MPKISNETTRRLERKIEVEVEALLIEQVIRLLVVMVVISPQKKDFMRIL